MDRYWLITWTCYGNWLPGDPRGFVSRVRDRRSDDPNVSNRITHNQPGTDCDRDISALRQSALASLKGDPIRLDRTQARILFEQFHETATYRGWNLAAVAIMTNHIHLVVGFYGDPAPDRCMGDFKAYGSRRLNQRFGKPPSDTWWTDKGSQRKLPNVEAIRSAIAYVLRQRFALLVWVHPNWEKAGGPTAKD